MRFETTIDIDAPADTVWDVLRDVEKWPDWTDSIDAVERLDTGPLAVGSKAKVKQPRLPLAEWTVTEVVPGRSFTWVATGPGVRTTGLHTVTPRGENGSSVTLGLLQAGPLGWVIGSLTGRMTRRYIGMEAAGLKKRSEGALR